MQWAAGEEERWRVSYRSRGWAGPTVEDAQWEADLALQRSGKLRDSQLERLLVVAPERFARASMEICAIKDSWYAGNFLRATIARFGVQSLGLLERFLNSHPKDAVQYAHPFDASSLAPAIADTFVRLKFARADARAWMEGHPVATALGCVPLAVGKPGKDRRAGEAALRCLQSAGHGPVVIDTASQYGEAALAAVKQILWTKPHELLPKKMPTLPAFYDVQSLPAPLLEGAGRYLCPAQR